VTLLFGLSLATGLPPVALLAPSGVLRPAALADAEVVLDPSLLAASATCLFCDGAWAVEAARSIAGVLDRPPPRRPLDA
jgi:hypothetical protein